MGGEGGKGREREVERGREERKNYTHMHTLHTHCIVWAHGNDHSHGRLFP